MAEEESVKVAVRMRLFNNREITANATRIVRMVKEEIGSKTIITNPETNEDKTFSFDFSFQSHSETEEGIGPYATQDTVFNDLGKPVLYSALEGRNVCLFAYGQTGAGKSFSMLGKAEPKELQGIIPRSCIEIFRLRDLEKDDPCVNYNISMQVVEIYCEMINDLLDVRKNWPPNGHKPKLTKDGYVVDTVTKPCFNYEDIEAAFRFADQNRSVGSHALNPESSRAHTIYTIGYQRQKRSSPDAKQAETINSKINLVDLAGSERSESAGTSGQMLKEGNAINLSLTALGSTIKALSEGKRPNFRDSKLTLLLQGSMTNGKVIMIAAVSPASICYDESVSTLRFAERIKMVKIKAKKNVTQDPVAEIKKEMEEMRQRMQEEIDQLRAVCKGDPSLAGGAQEKELRSLLDQKKEAERQLKDDFDKKLKEVQETDEDRKKKAQAINSKWAGAFGGASQLKPEDVKEPHLRNLNEDSRLAETLVYTFAPGSNVIGRSNKLKPPKIEFNGMGIVKDHAVVEWNKSDGKVWITPHGNNATSVNGKGISGKTELKHNMRLWLGNNYAFRFVFPGNEKEGESFTTVPDYLFAVAEISEANNQKARNSDGMPVTLGHQLSEALKKVEQANIIANDLNCECAFKPKIIKDRETGDDAVAVSVTVAQGTLVWPWEKFADRLVEMVKLWQQWQYCEDKNQTFALPEPTLSPFYDFEDQLIGEADVWLQSLGNMLEAEADAIIMSPSATSMGRIHTSISPIDKHGKEGPWDDPATEADDPFVDAPSELIGQSISWIVRVQKIVFDAGDMLLSRASGARFERVWVRYKIWSKDPTEHWTRTKPTGSARLDPVINFESKHRMKVTSEFAKHLEKGYIRFQVWGKLVEVGTNPETSLRTKQNELISLLKPVCKAPDPTGLPPGWSVVPIFIDTEGKYHRFPP
ncbi:Kinesin-like protein unc-104 [Diplonema papillatum]|nr:Kinesin-like protein unc-104 [Diplonema papillatum]